MTGNIRLFRKDALREAYLAGQRSALADPNNFKEAFEAGEKKGAAWLNESVNSVSFFEFMATRRLKSPGSFSSWFGKNEKRLSTALDKEKHELIVTETEIETEGKKMITLDVIADAVRHEFGITLDDLRYNARRKGWIKTPRFYAFYLAYFHARQTLKDTGLFFAGKDHATVMHGARVVSDNAGLYALEKKRLLSLYEYLRKGNYDLRYVQEDDRYSRSGALRLGIKPVKLDIEL